jgi:NAD-dependent SIR2 family protein deacetylase
MNENKHPTKVGEIRPSQLLHSFGIGAIVDLPNISVMVMGLDEWDVEMCVHIIEPRLLSAVQAQLGETVQALMGPPTVAESAGNSSPFGGGPLVGAPVALFPRWLRCTQCNRLARSDSGIFEIRTDAFHPDRVRYVHKNCSGAAKPPTAVPARFLTACSKGHLDEFPWMGFVHSGEPCDAPNLRLVDKGVSGQTAEIWVRCTNCGKAKQMSRAFGEQGKRELPMCRGRNPHLRNFQEEPCSEQLQAMLLGASNSWFPLILSSLAIPPSSDMVEQAVSAHWDILHDLESLAELKAVLKAYDKRGEYRELTKCSADKLWETLEKRRQQKDIQNQPQTFQDLKRPEWLLFSEPKRAPHTEDFQLRPSDMPEKYARYIESIVLVERLREVKALVGFTRIYPPADFSEASEAARQLVAPLTRGAPTWVPAAEVRGEGIFIQFRESAVRKWCERDAVRKAEQELFEAHKAWRMARNMAPPEKGFPGIRYALIHSFSHALMRRLALECGYSAASIRERIYSSDPGSDEEPMAGVLLYTAAPDSEGTLGGLVGLGQSASMSRNLDEALRAMQLCSSDPLCAEHRPYYGFGALHGASCHACLFASETSCERGNKYLDRSLLVETVAGRGQNFFESGT